MLFANLYPNFEALHGIESAFRIFLAHFSVKCYEILKIEIENQNRLLKKRTRFVHHPQKKNA